MKIIVSPTKTMKRKNYTNKISKPKYTKKSKQLRSILEGYDKKQIKTNYKVSDNLANKVYTFFQQPKEDIQAINLYEGMAFKNMDIENWGKPEFKFAQDHLYILSAMYGALKPLDLIKEYRLDYVMKFEENLYDFWKEDLDDLFKNEDMIINLASKEFSKGINNNHMINIHFLDEKGRNLSTQAKQGRGDMLAYIIKNKIIDVSDLIEYNNLDYKYVEETSDQYNYYFSKE